MRVHIALKDSRSFTLNNVIGFELVKHLVNSRWRRLMIFYDRELGSLGYPVTDIAEMHVED